MKYFAFWISRYYLIIKESNLHVKGASRRSLDGFMLFNISHGLVLGTFTFLDRQKKNKQTFHYFYCVFFYKNFFESNFTPLRYIYQNLMINSLFFSFFNILNTIKGTSKNI